MRKITLLLSLLLMIISCGVKQSQKLLNSGDYDSAIGKSVSGLRNNKDDQRKQPYVATLEDAYAKAKERDLREIDLLAKDANPRNLEKIFNLYQQLHNRQEQIKPLLPLKVADQNRNANFQFEDYSEQIINSKNALSTYLYNNTKALLLTNDKMSIRRAYSDLVYLDQINPGYKDTRHLIQQAKQQGSNYVSVYTRNDTHMPIPLQLEQDLLDFSTYGLDDEWTVYHSNKVQGITYDYGIVMNFRQINVTPNRQDESVFERQKEVLFGKKKKTDRRGNVVRDSLGNVIMVDDIRTVRATISEIHQFKSAQVVAKVDYINFRNNQLIQSFPISSEFIFENVYAVLRGDRRALDNADLQMLDRQPVPFPSNEQIVYDTGEDLKAKLKEIINRNRLGS
ncbi:MAG TPA: hypothetical protein VF581_03065 [Flavobacterium sp.]